MRLVLPTRKWQPHGSALGLDQIRRLDELGASACGHTSPPDSSLIYPKARVLVQAVQAEHSLDVLKAAAPESVGLMGRGYSAPSLADANASVDMLWANMALHTTHLPQTMLRRWHAALKPDGFLMFSCLGPDSLAEIRRVYAMLGWPAPAHAFTDMHDWGDMLVQAGAEPVMAMERSRYIPVRLHCWMNCVHWGAT